MFFNDCLLLLKDLITFPSVKTSPEEGAPFGKSLKEILNFTLKSFSDLGGKSTNLDGYCGYTDFGQGEMFGVLLHLDVVPAHEEGWTTPPFSLTEKEGKLYGRGTIDNKGSVAAIYAAIKKLVYEKHNFKKTLRVIFGCDEESGWDCIKHYVQKENLPSSGFAPDASFPVINYEKGILHFTATLPRPTELLKIDGGSKVNVVADKAFASFLSRPPETYFGKAAHASTPWLGESAILKMIFSLALEFAVFQSLITMLNFLQALFTKDQLTANLGLAYSDEDNVYFDIDIRYPRETTGESLLEHIKNFVKIENNSVKDKKPLYVKEDNPLVQTLLDAYNSIEKTNAKPITIGGGTYARALNNGVAFGPLFPGEKEVAHMDNEYISIKSLKKCINIYHKALKKLC